MDAHSSLSPQKKASVSTPKAQHDFSPIKKPTRPEEKTQSPKKDPLDLNKSSTHTLVKRENSESSSVSASSEDKNQQNIKNMSSKNGRSYQNAFLDLTEEPSDVGASSEVNKTASLTGFGRGLKPERILGIGVDEKTGEKKLLIKWRGSGWADFVSTREAYQECPQFVLQYYEEMIVFGKEVRLSSDRK